MAGRSDEPSAPISWLLSLLAHLFFAKISIFGQGSVPHSGGIIFVANHQNSLLDPLLLLCTSPRPPRFLAKSTLFKHPLVAPFLGGLRALPVYRRQDNPSESGKNDETFAACAEALFDGEAVAIFPEGRSHSEPHLVELKTGAARIASAARRAGAEPTIVPAGLIYSDPSTFRSDATVVYGSPVSMEGLPPAEGDDRHFVKSLTERIGESLRQITIDAENCEDLCLVEGLRGIASEIEPGLAAAAGNRDILLREMLSRYNAAKKSHPKQLLRLVESARDYQGLISASGLKDGDLALDAGTAKALKYTAAKLAMVISTYLPALYGKLFNFIPYTLTGPLAKFVAGRESDTVGTYKLYFGAALFPAAYTLQLIALSEIAGPGLAALLTAIAIPCGFWAESYFKARDDFFRTCLAFFLLLFKGRLKSRLKVKRDRVIDELRPFMDFYRG